MSDARAKVEAKRREYNQGRPHKAINRLSPLEYVATLPHGGRKFPVRKDLNPGTPHLSQASAAEVFNSDSNLFGWILRESVGYTLCSHTLQNDQVNLTTARYR